MELFWGIVLLSIGSAACAVDVVRLSRSNPGQRIPLFGRPPKLPRLWFLPRLVMVFAVIGGLQLLGRAADLMFLLTAVLLVVILLVPALGVAALHNRRIGMLDARKAQDDLGGSEATGR